MSFKEGDRVRIDEDSARSKAGELGTVTHVYDVNRTAYRVKLDSGNESGFFETELWPVDEKREALIELAETLDKARLQANAINGCDGDIYRTISESLYGVLGIIVGEESEGFDTYQNMVASGLSVREALAQVED